MRYQAPERHAIAKNIPTPRSQRPQAWYFVRFDGKRPVMSFRKEEATRLPAEAANAMCADLGADYYVARL